MQHHRPRLEKLRRELAENIPCIGDEEGARCELRSRSLSDLLITYFNWAQRFVPARRRALYFADGFWTSHANQHEKAIYELAALIRRGTDLTNHLSERVKTDGFALRAGRRRRGPEWGDKDYALNAFGAHHLHLTPRRSNELLYVLFAREDALAVHFGDHSSFDDGSLEEAVCRARAAANHLVLNGVLGLSRQTTPAERNSVARRGVSTAAEVAGKVVMSASLSTAGTSTFSTMHAIHVIRSLEMWDEMLDDPEDRRQFLRDRADELTDAEWAFNYTDLCIVDAARTVGVVYLPGPL